MSPDSLDYAITRYAVRFRAAENFAGGSGPYLPAFLAGWFCSATGVPEPGELGVFRESFRAGYAEQRWAANIHKQRQLAREGRRS